MMSVATLLDAALGYARRRDWSVFPLHTPDGGRCSCGKDCGTKAGKHSRITDWPNQATTNSDTIRQWWTHWPNANVGIVTGERSGFFVVDVDPRHGGDDTLAQLEAQHGALPATVEALTGGGGRHILFRYPGYPVKSGGGVLGPGVDIKADDGNIVATPSTHLSGRQYCWEASSHPDDVVIAEAPAWLLSMLTAKSNGNGQGRTQADWLALLQGAPDGTRYDVATGIAGHFLGIGRPVEEVEALIFGYLSQCDPPGNEEEQEKVRRMVRDFASKDAVKRESALTPEPAWPVLDDAALQGLAGEIVRAIDPYTEADPVGTLAHLLAGFGNLIGPGPHVKVQHDQHPARMNVVLVGNTSVGRKGTAWSTPRYLLAAVEEAWTRDRVKKGLSTGEGLIYHVRDPREEQQAIKDKGRVIDYETVIVDAGEPDKRLLVIEQEFATLLRRMAGEGNTLSAVIREAWDSGNLSTLTKNSPMRATGAHVSLIAHVTKDELLRYLTDTECANGFANRFLWLLVRKSKDLPDGGAVPEQTLATLAEALSKCAEFAKGGESLRRDTKARDLWHAVYPALTAEKPGMLGAILSRAQAQALRLSVLYAVLDCSDVIRVEHLKAALAVCDYAEASARSIFGEATGDWVADRILEALRGQGPMTETDISGLFQRNVKADRIHRALEMLRRSGLIESVIEETSGRKKTVWRATKKTK